MVMNLSFPDRLHLVSQKTPLQKLERITKALGPGAPNLWIKRDDLTGLLASGNKVRKLEFTLAKAKAAGIDTLITCGGIQSNHCRATAALGAQLGFNVHLVLRGPNESVLSGNHLLGSIFGAKIDVHPVSHYRNNLADILENLRQKYDSVGRSAMVIPTGASDGTGLWGYLAATKELEEDFSRAGIQPEYIVSATGSGGTQAGLTLGCHLYGLQAAVVGMAVCDNEEYFKNKVLQDIAQWEHEYSATSCVTLDTSDLKILVNDKYIGPGYGKATQDVYDCIRWVARTEGILLDPVYTGKAFKGLLDEIKLGAFNGAKDIIFIHTGGAFSVFAEPHSDKW